jgi:hypothetical protein
MCTRIRRLRKRRQEEEGDVMMVLRNGPVGTYLESSEPEIK